ncbi:MAG: Coenzyme F420 hydrogenase/dehydrogenase, beta subunit C-terminal domain [Promethearchaeota archaeon]
MTQEEVFDIHDDAARLAERKIKDKKRVNFATLRNQVIQVGICTECGACIASCPEKALEFVNGRPKLVGRCTSCSVCYNQCPRTITIPDDLTGEYKSAWTGRALLPEIKGQDGGIVTGLLLYLLKENMVDGVIVTVKHKEKPWMPVPKIITTPEELLESTGSVYTHCSTVPKLVEAIEGGMNSIAFVGTPCNIDAVHKMQTSPVGLVRLFMRANILKIGLFCMDTFEYDKLTDFISAYGVSVDSIKKMTIKKGKFHVYHGEDGEMEWKIHEMDHLRSTSCHYCTDLTSEHADISVGSVGSKDGYSTILARSGIGYEIIIDAIDNGYIEVEPLKRSAIRRVLNLARMKKVSLYTLRRRRTFTVLPPPPNAELSEQQPVTLEGKPGSTKLFRRIIKVKDVSISPNNPNMKVILANTSGKVLERVKIRISHLCDIFEECTWEIPISSWFPGEELEFEYPRVKENESEYLLLIGDHSGKIMSKRILVEKAMKS